MWKESASLVAACACVCACLVLLLRTGGDPPLRTRGGGSSSSSPALTGPAPAEHGSRHWIFDDLCPEEVQAVTAFVLSARNATRSSAYDAPMSADFITGASGVELMQPPKALALDFVDGRSDTPPPRFARVTIARGSQRVPDVMEYRVGPLHGCDEGRCAEARVDPKVGSMEPLLPDGLVPFAKRPMDAGDNSLTPLIHASLSVVKEALVAAFGRVWPDAVIPGCGDECAPLDLSEGMVFPFVFNDIRSSAEVRTSRVLFFWFRSPAQLQAMWLHPIPFSFLVDQRGPDPASWKPHRFTFCGAGPFSNAEAVALAFARGQVARCSAQKADPATEGRMGDWDVPGAPPNAAGRSSIPGPVQGPPDGRGARYTLGADAGGNGGRHVRWMGWDLMALVRPSTGLAVMDVRFKGQRIAYEVALSEAVATYSGTNLDTIFYLDSAYSLSQLSGDLLPGVDCPEHATFFRGTTSVFYDPAVGKGGDVVQDFARARSYKGACIFEMDDSEALWRHTQYLDRRPDGVRRSTLVVRQVATVGNYDYVTDVRFSLDGSVEVRMMFAGYCETRWFGAGVTPFERLLGDVVHEHLAAPLHAHYASFKVDLDIVDGSANSFERSSFGVGKPGGVPDLHHWPTKWVERTLVEKEGIGPSTATANPHAPGLWRIVHEGEGTRRAVDRPEAPMAPPGYAIMHGATSVQTLPANHPFTLAADYAKYGIAVSRRHDWEPRVTSVYDLYAPGEPAGPRTNASVDTFLADGEPLRNTDLVAWVTLGKEHLPRAEDLPLVSNFGTSFHLIPWNMFQANGAMDLLSYRGVEARAQSVAASVPVARPDGDDQLIANGDNTSGSMHNSRNAHQHRHPHDAHGHAHRSNH